MNEEKTILRNFLEIPYDELEQTNLEAYSNATKLSDEELKNKYTKYLKEEKKLKAVTLCFSDIEGRFHMLDYDKNFLLRSINNLTFDGSSIRGFSSQCESDLRLKIDWGSIRWLPSDVFGPGKIIMFCYVLNRDHTPYQTDFRGMLKGYCDKLKKDKDMVIFSSAEVEGFLVNGLDAEENFHEESGFDLISSSGYYHSLPLDKLKMFIDSCAEAQRAMGFRNEKDHPEVAPSQFELSFSYSEVLRACDNIQLYKLVCRQIANNMDMTATFLPKPASDINGNGMHVNFSIQKNNKNIFYDKNGQDNVSDFAREVISKILNHAPEICLALNSSVNSYRRLDPTFEAPNQIKASSIDRGSMVRIPIADKNSARLEIRSVAPDANPYLAIYAIIKASFEGQELKKEKDKRERLRYLPGNINDAIKLFKYSDFIETSIGKDAKDKYSSLKQMAADRSPKELGSTVKKSEVIYHHDVTNQSLWNKF